MSSKREQRYLDRCRKRREHSESPTKHIKRSRRSASLSTNAKMSSAEHSETSSTMYNLGSQICRKSWVSNTMDDKDLRTQIDLLRQLGTEDMKLARNTSEGWYFVRGAGLFNAALRCIDKLKKNPEGVREIDILNEADCRRQLQEIETSFLKMALNKDEVTSTKRTDDYKTVLESLREFSSKTINNIVRNDMKVDSITAEMAEEDEDNTIKNSKTFYNELSDRLKHFYRVLINDCISVLGKPECRFSVLGLGSLARKEATAYSDLESAILYDSSGMTSGEIEQVKHKFRLMVHYLHLKVLNLGETVLPSLCIPVLNDFNSELPDHMTDNKYFDITTPQGLCFDGAMPWASKTPIGRNKTKHKPARELIMTPDEMAQYQTESVCIKEGYHLSDVLMTTTLIYGDEDLLNTYDTQIKKIHNSPSEKDPSLTAGKLRASETLREDLEKYLKHPLTPETLSKQLNVKKDIYRFATISINTLKLKYNCSAQAPLDVLEELYKRNILRERAKKDLQVMVCICINLRHLVYSRYQRQKEIVSFVSGRPEKEDSSKSLSVRDFNAIYRFFLTFMPWSEFLKISITNPENLHMHMPRYIETSEKVKGMLHKEMNFFQNALLAFKKEEARLQGLGVDKNEELATIEASIGSLYISQGRYQDALTYTNKALGLEKHIHPDEPHPHVAASLNDTGNVCYLQGEYVSALHHHNEALEMYRLIYGKLKSKFVAISLNYIGKVHWRLGNYKNALSNLDECVTIYKQVVGNEADRDFADTLNTLGNVYGDINEPSKAIKCYNESCEMRKKIYEGVPHPDIAASLNNVGFEYFLIGENAKAMSCFNDCLKITKQLYGDDPHPYVAPPLNNIGEVHARLGEYKEALSSFNEVLDMHKHIYGGKPHPYHRIYFNIGNVYKALGEYTTALKYYNDRIEMMKQIYDDKAHPFVLETFEKMAEVSLCLNDESSAEMYNKLCFDMKAKLNQ